MWNWLKKLWQKQETVEDVYEKQGIDTSARAVGQALAGTRGIPLAPPRLERRRTTRTPYVNPAPPPSNDNLLTGILIGEMLSDHSPAEAPAPSPDFQGFGGGESGGGGASGSWDTPSDSGCSTDSSSSSDSSSSCDSGSSSDSGSSGGGDS